MRSVSPRQQFGDLSASFSGPVPGSSEQLSPTGGSPIGKQYGLTSSEILNQLVHIIFIAIFSFIL